MKVLRARAPAAIQALVLAVGVLVGGSCGDEAASNTGTEKVTLIFGRDSINGDTIVDEADIFQPTFLEGAHAALGRDFEGLEVTKVVLVKVGSATGINGWSDLFEGDLRVYLETPAGDSFLAAETQAPSGFGALSLPVMVTRAELSESADMLAGRITVRVLAKSGRDSSDFFSINVEAKVTFAAY